MLEVFGGEAAEAVVEVDGLWRAPEFLQGMTGREGLFGVGLPGEEVVGAAMEEGAEFFGMAEVDGFRLPIYEALGGVAGEAVFAEVSHGAVNAHVGKEALEIEVRHKAVFYGLVGLTQRRRGGFWVLSAGCWVARYVLMWRIMPVICGSCGETVTEIQSGVWAGFADIEKNSCAAEKSVSGLKKTGHLLQKHEQRL